MKNERDAASGERELLRGLLNETFPEGTVTVNYENDLPRSERSDQDGSA